MIERSSDARRDHRFEKPRLPPCVMFGEDAAADEVAEILVMYSCLEHWISRLPQIEAHRFAARHDWLFRGFEIATEPEHLIATVAIVEDSGLFDEFRERELVSPVPMLGCYRGLLRRFRLDCKLAGAREFHSARLLRLLVLH